MNTMICEKTEFTAWSKVEFMDVSLVCKRDLQLRGGKCDFGVSVTVMLGFLCARKGVGFFIRVRMLGVNIC